MSMSRRDTFDTFGLDRTGDQAIRIIRSSPRLFHQTPNLDPGHRLHRRLDLTEGGRGNQDVGNRRHETDQLTR